jgi:hypothetical protein
VLQRVAQALTWGVLALMAVLLVGSLFGRRGSLDDLTAAQIKQAVRDAGT